MTIKIRSLAVSGMCLLGIACSDASPAREALKTEVKRAPAMPAPKPSFAAEELAALAATAEVKPQTILDAPEQKTEPALDPSSLSKDSGTKVELAAAANHEEPIDYSRPLAVTEVTVNRFLLASGVESREPLDERDTFKGDEKIFAFMELANAEGEPYAFRVHWEPVAGPASPYGVELNVKTAPRFRTWSWTAIPREPGAYRAVLRTLDGEEIASRTFTIE
jgi:hypothetical protein